MLYVVLLTLLPLASAFMVKLDGVFECDTSDSYYYHYSDIMMSMGMMHREEDSCYHPNGEFISESFRSSNEYEYFYSNYGSNENVEYRLIMDENCKNLQLGVPMSHDERLKIGGWKRFDMPFNEAVIKNKDKCPYVLYIVQRTTNNVRRSKEASKAKALADRSKH